MKHLLSVKKGNSKVFFSYMRSKTKGREVVGTLKDQEGETAGDDQSKSALLNRYFSSVFTKTAQGDRLDLTPGEAVTEEGIIQNIYFDPPMVLNRLSKMKSNSSPGPDKIMPQVLQNMKEIIAYPLAVLFNKSVQQSDVPEEWKQANITPIFKKGKKSDPSNYRPVSLTSVVCKLLEGLIKDELVGHLEGHNLISPSQHGFRKKKSCVSNLLEYLDKVSELLYLGEPVDVVYLDFRKAFDLVSFPHLTHKLEGCGVRET